MDTDKTFQIFETQINPKTVKPCCRGKILVEHNGKEVKIGDTTSCPVCKTTFTLTEGTGKIAPLWKPA